MGASGLIYIQALMIFTFWSKIMESLTDGITDRQAASDLPFRCLDGGCPNFVSSKIYRQVFSLKNISSEFDCIVTHLKNAVKSKSSSYTVASLRHRSDATSKT